MQSLQYVLIVFALNFCKMFANNEQNSNLFKTNQKSTIKSDVSDMPSPEWIKYQQERYQNFDKLLETYQPSEKRNQSMSTTKISTLSTVAKNNMEITPRQKASNQEKYDKNDFEKYNNSTKSAAEEAMAFNVEFPSVQGFVGFMKTLKENWMKISFFRLEDKIKMLHRLKNTLLKAIEQKFMILWQDDTDDIDYNDVGTEKSKTKKLHANKRRKRGIFDESNISFPPEAALMSINFLTFAVFLIKLVLQVINIVKTKHYKLSTYNMTTDAIRFG